MSLFLNFSRDRILSSCFSMFLLTCVISWRTVSVLSSTWCLRWLMRSFNMSSWWSMRSVSVSFWESIFWHRRFSICFSLSVRTSNSFPFI